MHVWLVACLFVLSFVSCCVLCVCGWFVVVGHVVVLCMMSVCLYDCVIVVCVSICFVLL